MLINKEWVDKVCPEHGRTSCSDEEIYNGFSGWNGKYDVDTGAKIIKYPRCDSVICLTILGWIRKTWNLKFILKPHFHIK